jgi:hypothetical protein
MAHKFQIPGTLINYKHFICTQLVVHFNFLPAALAHVVDSLARGLYYVLIYVSYNKIVSLLDLLNLCNKIRSSSLKDFTWLG